MTRRLRAIAGLGVVAIVFALPAVGAAVDVGGAMEEGFMLVFPERVLAGAIPNRDFLHLYGPGSLWVLAAAFAVFGVHLWVERAVGAVQLAGVVLAVRAWTRPWGHAVATVSAVISVVFAITPIGFVALAWTGALALLLWGVLLSLRAVEEQDRPRWRTVAGGALCGFALLYRPDLALALGLAVILLVRPLARAGAVRASAAGLVAGAAPMLVHMALAGVGASIEGMVLDPVFRLRPGRALPVPPSSDKLDSFLQRVGELDVIRWPQPFTVPMQLRVWFFAVVAATLLLVVAALVASGRPSRTDRTDATRALRLRVMAAIAVGILPQAMQRPDATHLAWISCFTVAVLPVAVVELLPRRLPSPARVVAAAAVVIAAMAVLFPAFTLRPYAELTLQSFGRERNAVAVRHDGRLFYVGTTALAHSFDAAAADVDRVAGAGDRLFVGPADLTRTPFVDTWLYHLFPDLEPATYFIEMDPGLANARGSRLASDLESADVVVLTHTWDRWDEPNTSIEPGDLAPMRVLERDFCRVAEHGDLVVYERCR